MIGAVAGFKQQNAASGLPLRLLPEELALALDRGWVRGYRLRGEQEEEGGGGGGGGGEDANRGAAKEKMMRMARAADPFLGDDDDDGGEEEEGEQNSVDADDGTPSTSRPSSSSSWRSALAQGTHHTLRTAAPESLRIPFEYLPQKNDDGESSRTRSLSLRRLRPRRGTRAAASHSVFRDLHSRGYSLTPGANFGAHWLAYPADPMLYHAQLCVRVCCRGGDDDEEEEEDDEEEEQEEKKSSALLCPTLLAAATRGAHAARKHLLLAYPVDGNWDARVQYLTIAPEAGFGS